MRDLNKKTISVMTACYNEVGNVTDVYQRVRAAIATFGTYRYEHIFIDNASRDGTFELLKKLAASDPNVKIIRNTRNFGHIRSPMHAMLQARGDVVIGMSADLQDPPELIVDMIREWEHGTPVVIAVKHSADESGVTFWLRQQYYRLINRVSHTETYENFTGFGLYDRKVMDLLRQFDDPYPYFRGMIAEIGFPHAELPYHQPARKRGITKNNIYTLYDMAMLGITNLSKVPLRLVTFAGFAGAVLSVLISLGYLVYKLVFWNQFSVGIAPLLIGMFFLTSIQLLFIGIIGEYIGSIHTMVQKRPLVVEQERINFEYEPGEPLREPLLTQQAQEG